MARLEGQQRNGKTSTTALRVVDLQNSGTSGVGFEGKSDEGWHQWLVRYGQSVHRVSDSICLDAKIGSSLV